MTSFIINPRWALRTKLSLRTALLPQEWIELSRKHWKQQSLVQAAQQMKGLKSLGIDRLLAGHACKRCDRCVERADGYPAEVVAEDLDSDQAAWVRDRYREAECSQILCWFIVSDVHWCCRRACDPVGRSGIPKGPTAIRVQP